MRFRLLVSGLVAVLLAAFLVAAPASAQWSSQPTMIGDNEVSVIRGDASWISVAWTAPSDMDNFRIEVTEWQEGTETAYPAGGVASHLNGDPTLSAGEIGTTSFRISTSATTPSNFFVQVVAIWEFEGETYRYHPGGINVRVVDDDGEQFELLSDEATVSSIGDGAGNWVELDFLGLAPTTDDLRVTVTGGPEIYYPQGSFTSLHHDDRLHSAEEDVARFWIDPALVDPGRFDLTLTVSYRVDGQAGSESFPFALEIT